MGTVRQNISEFSHNGKLYAHLNDQGILQIWDTEANKLSQEYKPNLHLAGACTALTWILTTTKETTDVSQDGHTESQYLVLGNTNGKLCLYSYSQAEIASKFKGDGHTGRVTCITKDLHGNIFSCGEDSLVVVWSLSEQQQKKSWSIGTEKPYSLLYMPAHKRLAVGARQIFVYDVQTHKLLQKFVGQASKILLLKSIGMNNEEYLLSASRMDRMLCMWKLGQTKKNNTAVCSLITEDVSRCISCGTNVENNVQIISVTKSGVLHAFVIDIQKMKAEKPVKPKLTIQVISNENATERIPIVISSIELDYAPDNALCGYGNKHYMAFEKIRMNFTEKVQILERKHPKEMTIAKKNDEELQKVNVPIVKPEEVDYRTSVIKKKKTKVTDLPMELRLKNLESDSINNVPSGPDSHSKVQLLHQALQSKDQSLLNTVLCSKDVKMIDTTVRKLPIGMIGDLVDELTKFMEKESYYLEFAILWLKSLMNNHMSQLMAMGKDDLLNKFGPCIGIMQYRASCLNDLTSACGRLDLLISQARRNKQDDMIDDNCQVYNFENTNEIADMNDGNTSSSNVSDDDWEDSEDEVEEMELDDESQEN